MEASFELKLTDQDWNEKISAWRCLSLRIPEVEINSIYAGDNRLSGHDYDIDRGLWVIHWKGKTRQPKEIQLLGTLSQKSNQSRNNFRWNKPTVMFSGIASLILVLIAQW